MPRTIGGKSGLVMSGTSTPTRERAAGLEAAGDRVGPVAELPRGGLHALPRGLVHQVAGAVAEHARDGGRVNTRALRNVAQLHDASHPAAIIQAGPASPERARAPAERPGRGPPRADRRAARRPSRAASRRPASMTAPCCAIASPARAFCSTSSTVRPSSFDRRDRLEHHLARLRVEPHRRLVEQDQPRVEHQRPRQLDELLLAAGQRARRCPGARARSGSAPPPPRCASGRGRGRRARARPAARSPTRS